LSEGLALVLPGAAELAWGLLSALFWIAFIAVLVKYAANSRRPTSPRSALAILEERYARGEIDRDEFVERKSVLSEERL
jgi:putative membrane protein